MVSKSDKLYVFNSDLCRSVYLTCDDGSESVVSGVTAYHFTPPPSVFASQEDNPDNRGFCTPEGDCRLGGVLNVTNCRGISSTLCLLNKGVYHILCRTFISHKNVVYRLLVAH